MPLDAYGKVLTRNLDGLGHAVGGASREPHSLAEACDAAVMTRVHLNGRAPSNCVGKQRPLLHLDWVRWRGENLRVAPLCHALGRTQARHIHAQSSPQCNIEQLRAAAGPQKRLVGRKYTAHEREFKAIALGAQLL